MRSFKDNKGREWQVELNVLAIRTVKDQVGVLLTGLFTDDAKPLAELTADPCKLVDVVWALCSKQHEDVSDEEFATGLGGDALGAATEALIRAVVDFFPSPAQRAGLHEYVDKLFEMSNVLAENAIGQLGQYDLNRMAKTYLERVTSGLESQELTPPTGPSENSA